MNWKEKVLADFPNDLQRAHRAQQAVRELEEAIRVLASLGHPLHVEEGYQPPPFQPFPKAVFNLRAGTRVVHCQAELAELGGGWYGSMEEARYAAGLSKQFQRGGIFDKSLPSVKLTPEERAAIEAADRVEQERVHRYAEEMREAHRKKGRGKVEMPGAHS